MNLDFEFLNNSLEAWAIAIGIALAINIVIGIVKWIAIHRFAEIARRTHTSLDDAVIEVIKSLRQWLILLMTFYIGSRYLDLSAGTNATLRKIAIIAAFFQAGLWLGAVLNFWIHRARDKAMRENAAAATGLSAIGFIARVTLWIIVALLMLDNLGIDVTALVAGLGVGGIAIALAVQNILGDLLASLSIVLDKPFVIGDFIVVDDLAGTVEHVGLKTTRLRSLSGEQLVFSNGDLLKSRLHNYKRMQERRVLFGFGVVYQTTADQLQQIVQMVRDIIAEQPATRFDRAHFKGFGESSLDFEVVYWMLDPDYNKYMDTQQTINLVLLRRFAEQGLSFAYPTRTLQIDGPIRFEAPDKADEDEEKAAAPPAIIDGGR